MNQKCVIWQTPLSVIEDNQYSQTLVTRSYIKAIQNGELYEIYNPKAGGKYTISYKLSLVFRPQDNQEKIQLSGYIAQENLKNNTPSLDSLIKDNNWLEKLPPIPNPSERAYLLLEGLVKQTDFIGKTFNYSALINSLDENNSPNSFFYALSYCDKRAEIMYLLNYLEKMQFIDINKNHGQFMNLQVSVKGLEKINTATNINSKIAFIAMWIDSKMDKVHKSIEKAINKAGYEPLRIDKKDHIKKIDDQILVEINKAKFIICDLTSSGIKEPRGSVYFEAGYALGKGIPIIWTCSKAQIKELPFDIRQYNCLPWEKDKWQKFEEKLKNRIKNVIGKGPL